MRRTKIVATLGPSSSSADAIRALVRLGVDVFRLNFSHGTHDTHREAIGRIRREAEAADRPVAILQDLSGPKIRTGRLRDGTPLTLAEGDELRIAFGDAEGEAGRVFTTYTDLRDAVTPGSTLLLDDGRIQLRVEETSGGELRTRVVDGGTLGERKGINVPGATLPARGLTAKDAEDLRFGVAAGVDLVAMSFVQRAADLQQLRAALAAAGAPDMPIVAKLERPEAVARLDEILAACDAIMVARGDLGLEVPLEDVPSVQTDVVRRAAAGGVPVILATQVFESMRTEPRPTRAEVSDAANAVYDYVDAIMLAGETAAGGYPLRAVQTLDAVIHAAEQVEVPLPHALERSALLPPHGVALCRAAAALVEAGGADAIVAVTRGGKTARVLAALRPRVPVFAATDSAAVARRLAVCRGVVPIVTDLSHRLADVAAQVGGALAARGAIASPSVLVLVSVTPDAGARESNVLKVQSV